MAMLVVLFESDEGEVLLGSRAVTRLARLGVTSVALLSDDRTICVVLEGWAFDPAGSPSDVVSAISAITRSARTLQPAMQITVEGVPRTCEAGKTGPLITDGGES